MNHDEHDSTVHYIFYDDVRRHDTSKLVNCNAFVTVNYR